jgi:4'-phosphopantetheinyl transferase
MKHVPLFMDLDSEAHIWLASPDEHSDPKLLARYSNCLSEEERKKCASFRFFQDRISYLVGHALLRTALSSYTGVPPEEWVFTCSPTGRPEILGVKDSPPFRFNISRTRGMQACLIVLSIDAGVDIENTGRDIDPIGIAEQLFSQEEICDLRSLPEALQRERFFSYWTLKEAYSKALGMGLSLPFNLFRFDLDSSGAPRLCASRVHNDDPLCWQFAQLSPAPSYVLSAALRRGLRSDFNIRIIPFKPWSKEAYAAVL